MMVIDDLSPDQAMTFNGGEEHLKLTDTQMMQSGYNLAVRRPTSQNLFRLAMAVNATKAAGYTTGSLLMPYFPGARQDRIDILGTPLSVKVYANFINSLKFDQVHILDPHSDVTTALIDNVRVLDHASWFKPLLADKKMAGPFTFLFPDSGAAKKYYSQYKDMGDILFCTKSRDPKTGKLSNFQVPSLKGREETSIWIIDDICDGGGTFLEIANQITDKINPAFLGLAVTHGIFSRGVMDLISGSTFDVIATTTSMKTKDSRAGRESAIWEVELFS